MGYTMTVKDHGNEQWIYDLNPEPDEQFLESYLTENLEVKPSGDEDRNDLNPDEIWMIAFSEGLLDEFRQSDQTQ